jgi:hypothetical protein
MFATAVAYLYMFPVSDFDSAMKRNPPVADGNSMMSVHGSLSAGEGLPSPKNMFSEALLDNQTERATTNAVVAVTPTDVNSTSTISHHSNNSNNSDGSDGSSSSDAPSTPTPSMPTPAMAPSTSASLQTPSRRAAATDSTSHNFNHSHPSKGGGDGNGGSSSIPNNSSGNGDSGGSPYFQHHGDINNDNDDDDEEVHSDNSEWFESNGNSKTKSGRRRRRRSFWAALRTALLPTELVMVCGWLLFFCIEVFVFVFLFPYFFCSNTRLEAR